MTHPKDPRLNGWKYKSFNLNDKEHAAVVQMYEDCSRRYDLKQKTILPLVWAKTQVPNRR